MDDDRPSMPVPPNPEDPRPHGLAAGPDGPAETPPVPTPPANARPGDTWAIGPTPASPPLQEPVPVRSNRKGIVAALLVAALVLGAGMAGAFIALSGSDEALLQQVPASANIVAVAYLDPDAGQKMNLFRMSDAFPGLGSRDELVQRVNGALDDALQQAGLTHDDLSWVGSEIGIAADLPDDLIQGPDPHFAFLLAADDEGAAFATLSKMRAEAGMTFTESDHDGVQVWSAENGDVAGTGAVAIVDGTVVLASDLAWLESIIDVSHGAAPSITEEAGYADAVGQLPDGKLGFLYANLGPLTDLMGIGGDALALGGGMGDAPTLGSMAVSVSAEPDGLAIDVVTSTDPSNMTEEVRAQLDAPDHENPLLRMVPGDALGIYSQTHVAASFRALLDSLGAQDPKAASKLQEAGLSDELIDSLTGDVAVEGSLVGVEPGFAALIGTDDPAALADALPRLIALAAHESSTVRVDDGSSGIPTGLVVPSVLQPAKIHWATEEHDGITVTYSEDPADPVNVAYAVVDGAGVIATSSQEIDRIIDVAHGAPSIVDDPGYNAAASAVAATDGIFYLDVSGALVAVHQELPPELVSDLDREVTPNLEPIEAVVMGVQSDASHQHMRLFVRIP